MNKIDKLIKEMCPNGVEYKKLKELCIDNFWIMPQTPSFIEKGIPYITSKNIRNGNINFQNVKYISENDHFKLIKNRKVKKEDFLISMIGTIGEVAIVKESDLPFYGQNMYLIRLDFDKVDIRFFYHYFTSSIVKNTLFGEKNNGNQGYLKTANIELLNIPLPPIKIQKEIVKILDKFVELEARKKQYAFYIDKIYNVENAKNKNIEVMKLEKIGEFIRGKRFVRNDISAEGTPCIHYGDLYTHYGVSATESKCFLNYNLSNKMRYANKGDVVIVQAGENDMEIGIGVAWLGEEKVAVHDACYIFTHNINSKYISHYLRSNIYHLQIKQYVSRGKICAINSKGIGKALIPVPSLEEQERIVDILDKFDKLVNDIKEGLPAEIEMRRKQYEYYRNKLLTFEELDYEY
ncbi:MAG TPA: restriction endonuclease subunit S [Bacilli bacterium]|nr:restriction endonuclease subunit S [Bacilli bacterium]